MLKSTREAAGEAILELAQAGVDVAAVAADTSKSMYTTMLGKEFPERSIEVGIAEQNMMMVAAGLASAGKVAFAASYSVFTSMRCCEQLRTFIAYPGLNVNVVAGIGGLSAGIEGVTHVATEDLGVVRCIAGATVVAPCDYVSTKKAIKAVSETEGLGYIRVGRDPSKVLWTDDMEFRVGYPVVHKTGKDVTIIGCGLVMEEVLEAKAMLADMGIDAEIIEMHTLKPILDEKTIMDSIAKTGNVITVEEHNVVGGLATVIQEMVAGKMVCNMTHLGLKDTFADTGTPAELRTYFGIDAKSIADAAGSISK